MKKTHLCQITFTAVLLLNYFLPIVCQAQPRENGYYDQTNDFWYQNDLERGYQLSNGDYQTSNYYEYPSWENHENCNEYENLALDCCRACECVENYDTIDYNFHYGDSSDVYYRNKCHRCYCNNDGFNSDAYLHRRYGGPIRFSSGISSYVGTSTGPGPNGGYPGTPRGVYKTNYFGD